MTFRYCTEFDAKTHIQRPTRHSVVQTLRRNFHWKCLLLTLLIHACTLYAIWCHLNRFGGEAFAALSTILLTHLGVGRVCTNGYALIPSVFGLLLYIVYIVECWHYRRRLTRVSIRSSAQIYAVARRMRDAIPIVWWKSVCYHYLRRTRQVTRYRNGDAITATQVYYERVNSHSSGNVFHYDTCGYKDISTALADLENYPLIRVRFTKGFVFACVQAADEFEEQRTRFFNENEVRDDYMEVREGLDLAGVPFIEQVLVYAAPSVEQSNELANSNVDDNDDGAGCWKAPWYMRPAAYWTASALLLSWPLRMLVECRTAHLTFQVTKLFGTNYLSPSSVNYTGPLTRTSTMESAELELANRNNYIIIPSYSEAILLDPLINSNVSNNNCDGAMEALGPLRSNCCNNNSHATVSGLCTRTNQRLASNECLVYANYGSIAAEYDTNDNSSNMPLLTGYEALNGANIAATGSHRCHLHHCAAHHSICQPHCRFSHRCEHDGGSNTSSNCSPYRQTLQRLLAGVRQGAGAEVHHNGVDFSPYRRFVETRNGRRFSLSSLTPRQLRSKSMTFFNDALSAGGMDATKATHTPAVTISRPSHLSGTTGSRLGRVAKLSRVSRDNASKRLKLPPRSITFAEGMRPSELARNSYEYSRRIEPYQSQQTTSAVRAIDAPAAHYCEACDSVVVERGTRRIVAAGASRLDGSPFRRTAGALAIVGIDEPPPPYEVALRMCAPIYERLRRSTASISSLLNTFSASNNNNNNNNVQP